MKIGIDMVDVTRFENYERIAKKIFSSKEITFYNSYNDKKLYVASRYCLKEAFLKALGKGIFDVNLNDIEVLKENSGEVYIIFKNNRYSCSLSHENNYCVGVAIYD